MVANEGAGADSVGLGTRGHGGGEEHMDELAGRNLDRGIEDFRRQQQMLVLTQGVDVLDDALDGIDDGRRHRVSWMGSARYACGGCAGQCAIVHVVFGPALDDVACVSLLAHSTYG